MIVTDTPMRIISKKLSLTYFLQKLQLSKKQKPTSGIFAAYLKSTSNFEDFGKKDDPHRLCIFEIRDRERCGQLMSKKPHLRTPFGSQHFKQSQKPHSSTFIKLFHHFGKKVQQKHQNATKRATIIIAEESKTEIIATELQNLHNCKRRWDLHNS